MAKTPTVDAIESFLGDGGDQLQWDPATADPSMHYRWTSQRNIRRRMAQGYTFVSRKDTGMRLMYEFESQEHEKDTIEVGGMVLMACPKVLFRRRDKQRTEMARARLGAGQQSFENKARQRDVEILRGDEKEERLR
jgi:hypothetical protein